MLCAERFKYRAYGLVNFILPGLFAIKILKWLNEYIL